MVRALCLLLALLVVPGAAAQSTEEGPFFVTLGSFSEKAAAQAFAARHGGWVLRTDLYRGLTPGYFAVVHGPFPARAGAAAVLAALRTDHPDAFVRPAGPAVLPGALGDAALLAAVLGDLVVVSSGEPSLSNPCAPTEPHLTVLVGFGQSRHLQADAPAAGFWVIERTGEVRPIRHCAE